MIYENKLLNHRGLRGLGTIHLMRTGTNHFISIDAAIKYYAPQGESREDVLNKWKNLEICIGEPLAKDHDNSYLEKDKDGRYWIISKD